MNINFNFYTMLSYFGPSFILVPLIMKNITITKIEKLRNYVKKKSYKILL